MRTLLSTLLTLALLCVGIGLAETGREQEEEALKMWIGQTAVAVTWDDNDAVQALRELVAEEPAEEPTSEWLDQFTAEELFEEVCHLPEGYRTIFNLYYLEGLSHREIADLMGIRERSSSSQLARARTALARRLMNKKRNNHDKE